MQNSEFRKFAFFGSKQVSCRFRRYIFGIWNIKIEISLPAFTPFHSYHFHISAHGRVDLGNSNGYFLNNDQFI